MIDTTVAIWEHLYKVKIPQLESTSDSYIRQYGTYVTGDKGIDNELKNQWLITMITIDRMVDLHREGIPIRVCNYGDTKKIYEDISAHLLAWKNHLSKGLNIGGAPIDDLIAMDEFANTVYDHAKYQFTRDIANSLLEMNLGSVLSLNMSNIFNKPPPKEQRSVDVDGVIRINQIDSEEIDKRESYSDFLKSRLVGFRM